MQGRSLRALNRDSLELIRWRGFEKLPGLNGNKRTRDENALFATQCIAIPPRQLMLLSGTDREKAL